MASRSHKRYYLLKKIKFCKKKVVHVAYFSIAGNTEQYCRRVSSQLSLCVAESCCILHGIVPLTRDQ